MKQTLTGIQDVHASLCSQTISPGVQCSPVPHASNASEPTSASKLHRKSQASSSKVVWEQLKSPQCSCLFPAYITFKVSCNQKFLMLNIIKTEVTNTWITPLISTTWAITWHWLCMQVLVLLCIDHHCSSHQWREERSNNRGIKLCYGDARRKSHLLNHLRLHRGPKVFYIHFTWWQVFWPSKLQRERNSGQIQITTVHLTVLCQTHGKRAIQESAQSKYNKMISVS